MQLGCLEKIQPTNSKDKTTYILEMGSMDIAGHEVQNLDEQFLHV